MLIEFSVANFTSIQAKQTLSLVASGTASEMREENTFPHAALKDLRLVRSAVVYGANAAGKSNLIAAMFFMRKFIIQSASAQEMQAGEAIAVKPFLYNKSSVAAPSEFEIIFLVNNTRYQYGFVVDQTRVINEWLLAYPNGGRVQRWFERKYNEENKEYDWSFSTKFKGAHKVWQDATRENALFFSTAVQLNSDQLTPLFNWFKKQLHIIPAWSTFIDEGFSAKQCNNPESKNKILEIIANADSTIDDVKIEEQKEVPEIKWPKNMPEEVKNYFKENMVKQPAIKFLHKIKDSSEQVSLAPENESEGTRKLFALAGPLLDILNKGSVLIVDELNNSMHPLLIRYLIRLMHNKSINKQNAQLFFSTHDTSLLDNDLFRRDQIWFVEKNEVNATQLYPLTDFSPRKSEALNKGYLQGRYGALPYIGSWNFNGE